MAKTLFLTVKQVAEMAHLHPRTVRVKIQRGLLPAHKPPQGKNWLIQRADAEAMLTGYPSPSSAQVSSPLIDRMGSSAGRARAVAVLHRLGDDRDEAEQQVSAERLGQVLSESSTTDGIQMRRWNPETGEPQDQTA